jgi:glycosyltransferase involved in cell wall biosynthesis
MKVMFVEHSGLPGGGQLGLARYLAHSDALDSHVALLGDGTAFDGLPAPMVVRLSGGRTPAPGGFLRSVYRLYRHTQKIRPDVAIANSRVAAIALALIPRTGGLVKIFYARSDLDRANTSRAKFYMLTWGILPRFQAFLSNSVWTQSTLPPRFARKPSAVAYPVSGVTGGRHRPVARRAGDPLRVVSLSRIARWKGTHVLLGAIRQLNEAGWSGRIHLTLAGAAHHEDAHFEREMRKTVERDLPNVSMVGHLAETTELLRSADVLVLASTKPEPFGQVVPQGMLSGAVVIATDMGGPAEMIEHDRSGILVEPDSSVAIADQLVRLGEDPELLERISRQASDSARAFDDDSTVSMLNAAILALHARVEDTGQAHSSGASGATR